MSELHEKRGRLVTQAREALEEIKTNTDESRAAELNERHDKIMAEFDAIDALIAREEKLASIEARAKEAEERARASRRPGSEAVAAAADAGDPHRGAGGRVGQDAAEAARRDAALQRDAPACSAPLAGRAARLPARRLRTSLAPGRGRDRP